MRAHDIEEPCCAQVFREQEVTAGRCCASTAFAAAFDDTDGRRTGKMMRICKPWSRVNGGAPDLDAAMVAVCRRDHVVGMHRRIGEEVRDIGLDAALAALQGEHVIGALVANRLSGLLFWQCIASAVTTAPSRARSAISARTAGISFDLPGMPCWPSTMRAALE